MVEVEDKYSFVGEDRTDNCSSCTGSLAAAVRSWVR